MPDLGPFKEIFDYQLEQIRQVIKEEIMAGQNKQLEERLLSYKEACNLFVPAITRPTLEKLCTGGRLQKQHVGSRIYFLYSDVMKVIKNYKRYEQVS